LVMVVGNRAALGMCAYLRAYLCGSSHVGGDFGYFPYTHEMEKIK